jgi:hypothetical protein
MHLHIEYPDSLPDLLDEDTSRICAAAVKFAQSDDATVREIRWRVDVFAKQSSEGWKLATNRN